MSEPVEPEQTDRDDSLRNIPIPGGYARQSTVAEKTGSHDSKDSATPDDDSEPSPKSQDAGSECRHDSDSESEQMLVVYRPPLLPRGVPHRVVTTQPGSWMKIPPGISDCPSGLERLASIDRVFVYQLIEPDYGGYVRDKYTFTIQNSLSELVYMAVEDASCCTRECESCAIFPYNMKIVDSSENEIMNFNRPFKCQGCCCPCSLQTMEISTPSGGVLGTVKEDWSIISSRLTIYNEAGEAMFKIIGPCSKTGEVLFKITTRSEIPIGIIMKRSSGVTEFTRKYFNKYDGFALTFPLPLDVKMKAVCLGAVFLIKSMYFELQKTRLETY